MKTTTTAKSPAIATGIPPTKSPAKPTVCLPSANSSIITFTVGLLGEKDFTLFAKCAVIFASSRKTRCLLNKALHTTASQSNFPNYAEKAISDEIGHIMTLGLIAKVFGANVEKANQRVYTTLDGRSVTISDCRNRIYGNGETAECAKAVSAFANA